MFSFWEKESFLKNDLIIIGGGIVGLSVAANVLEKHPEKKVVILERGLLPTGASTKNVGIAGTNDFTGFMDDTEKMGEKKTLALFYMRYQGRNRLIKRLGIDKMDLKLQGAYELITDEKSFSVPMMRYANNQLRGLFKRDVFVQRDELIEEFGFSKKHVKHIIENVLDGQIDTGLTIRALYQYVTGKGALYLTGADCVSYSQLKTGVQVLVKNPLDPSQALATFDGKDLVVCTNAFANNLSKQALDVVPGRGQVLITKPIENLKFKGVFSFEEGFYYFRDFNGRLLFGGGRNTDLEVEQTMEITNTKKIMENLEKLIKEIILPETPFEIDSQWSGIMCFSGNGKGRTPIVTKESENVVYAVRMNGSGMAIASNVAEEVNGVLYGFPSLL